MVIKCAWCGLVASGDAWMPDQAGKIEDQDANVSHGICSECAGSLRGGDTDKATGGQGVQAAG